MILADIFPAYQPTEGKEKDFPKAKVVQSFNGECPWPGDFEPNKHPWVILDNGYAVQKVHRGATHVYWSIRVAPRCIGEVISWKNHPLDENYKKVPSKPPDPGFQSVPSAPHYT